MSNRDREFKRITSKCHAKKLSTSANRNTSSWKASRAAHLSDAAIAASVSHSLVYMWRKADKDFAGDWDLAYEMGADALAGEAQRRGANGVDEPIFYQGAVCGAVRKYSDTLLMFMMKVRDPDAFLRSRSNRGSDEEVG